MGHRPGVVEPFEAACREAEAAGRLVILGRHKVTGLVVTDGAVTGVHGHRLADHGAERGVASSREVTGDFELTAGAVVVASGGVGANLDLIRQYWPQRLGAMPRDLVVGVPAFVDGSMLHVSEEAGARIVNRDRMWHYTEGIANHSPVWPGHGIRILPGPSSMWLDADGNRLPTSCYPGFDTLGTLSHLRSTGADHSWFVLTRRVIEKEFALSGSEQNPDLTAKSVSQVLGRVRKGAPAPVQRFLDEGEDFAQARTAAELAAAMNSLVGGQRIDPAALQRLLEARDLELASGFGKDAQIAAIRAARRYRGDRLIRTVAPHRFLDPANGSLIAVRLRMLTRKTLVASRPICPRGPWAPTASRCRGSSRRGSGWFRGRGSARLQLAGGNVPGRVPVLRESGRQSSGGRELMRLGARPWGGDEDVWRPRGASPETW